MNIYTLSRAGMENIRDHFSGDNLGKGSALISIGNPGQTTGNIDESLFGGVLRLHFHDADPNVSHGQVKGMRLLDHEQVKSVIEFVNSANPDTLFVQCQAGQSRSCGMAYALHEHYNDGDLKDGWENYNRHVYQKMKESLRGYRKDRDYYNRMFNQNN